jgi:iron complex transport system permease protein
VARNGLAAAALFACFVINLFVGVTVYSPWDLVTNQQASSIVFGLRLPRGLCAVLVGAGLALVGAIYQALFRNYLASPFTLGVSAGAALAASSALVLGWVDSRYGFGVGVWALLGALLSIFLIVLIDLRRRRGDSNSLLLVGVMFSFFCSSLMTLSQYLADYSQLFQVTRWMMGGIPSASWFDLMLGFVLVSGASLWAWSNRRALDLALFGDDLATVKGVDVRRFSRVAFIITSFVVGWVVAQCGVIGFVGLIVPALARSVVGVAHERLLPLAVMGGAILVLICDTVGRVIVSPLEIPAGVFTALLGGPVFVWLLLRK